MFFTNQYIVTVRDESQQITKRLVRASSPEKAVLQLKSDKCRVLAIEPRPSLFWQGLRKGKFEFTGPASKRDLATFSNNLALMVLVRRNVACVINASLPMGSVL